MDCPVSEQLIVPVVLSGGGGTRLWPYSTNETPKQFLRLLGQKTLFSETLARVSDRRRFEVPIVVAGHLHAELCKAELSEGGHDARLIIEPCARNTAAAIGLAAKFAVGEFGGDALLLVMPSDHVIDDVPAFLEAVRVGEAAARAGHLVTFGVRPTYADTGYGYIQSGSELTLTSGALEVERFVEKPPRDRAEAMVADGKHLWNAGIFLFQAQDFLDELNKLAPKIDAAAAAAIAGSVREGIRILPSAEALETCPSESIDYAVMEHSSRVAVVPMAAGWSDLGSWDALAGLAVAPADEPVTLVDCDDCYVRSDGPPVAALGVRDLIVVASHRGVLVLPRGRSQEVKRLLAAMADKCP